MANLKFIQVNEVLGANLLNMVWVIIGLIAIYAGVKNLLDNENPSRYGTALFWCSFGVVCGFGTWLPAKLSGVLVIVMCLPPIFKKVKVGKVDTPSKEHTIEQYQKVGDRKSVV